MGNADTAKPTKKFDDENELIESMDILADMDVLKSEPDWRILKDSESLDKYIKQTGKKTAGNNEAAPAQGESHD